ncbi:unnamed protein product [Phytophthora fragariaefolia]|uniref:Unnamed protein product n=1 Tax=Phytophthora fragariaefolia TaxID=1490495 RepID=A0A9W6YHQ9_9STRA|nr:unnamed protein product [Phytophthora fragariaefolia]
MVWLHGSAFLLASSGTTRWANAITAPADSTGRAVSPALAAMPTSPHHLGHENSPKHNYVHSSESVGDMAQVKSSSDRDTIVDMSLRIERFILCVGVALAFVFAFGIYFLVHRQKTLTYIDEKELVGNETLSSKASTVVENYNTISGYLQFMGSSIFTVYCDMLIFPTLVTYLHNCSLYPGDQPARAHSKNKERCIFWGLKTVIILINIGFTSVYVGKDNLTSETSRRLTAYQDLTPTLLQTETPYAVDSGADTLHSILRTSVASTTPFEFRDTCRQTTSNSDADQDQQWGAWADDVDTTSVSFSFPSHAWNTALLSSKTAAPTNVVEIPLRDYLADREKYVTADGDWDLAELYSTYQQGVSKLGLSVDVMPTPRSFDDFIHAVVSELKTALPNNARVSDLVLRLELRGVEEEVRFTSLTLSIPVEADNSGTVLCGSSGCVVRRCFGL